MKKSESEKRMLADDVIEESQSEWNSPVILVPKKSNSLNDKKWRVVIDNRKVNEKLKDDKFPLAKYLIPYQVLFTHLDLTQSYYQL